MFQTKFVEALETFCVNFFLILAFYEIVWKDRAKKATDDYMVYAHCRMDN